MATSPTANDDALQLSSYTKSPQVVAELLRLFLAALPEPLLTFQLYDSFLLTQTIQSPADRVWAYRFLLAYLPPGFRSSVKLLLTLLFNLSRSGEANGMDANTLASVFGSYFLRSEEELYYMKDDPALVVQIVALLIQEYPIISTCYTGLSTRSLIFLPFLLLPSLKICIYESVLRAAPTAPPARTLNSGAQTAASSFPASPTPPHVPRIQGKDVAGCACRVVMRVVVALCGGLLTSPSSLHCFPLFSFYLIPSASTAARPPPRPIRTSTCIFV